MTEPRAPLSVGAVVVWTIINPLFGLIALAVRNNAIRDSEPRIAPLMEDRAPAVQPMGPFFRTVMLFITVGLLVTLSIAVSGGK